VKRIARILVPLDHSPGGEAVLEYAAAVARGLGATIALLHVYWPPNSMVSVVPGASVAGEVDAERTLGEELLARGAETLRSHGLDGATASLERSPSASLTILHHAQRGPFDLIVMGTHGRKGATRLVMGSVTEQVLRSAPCPVLAVHLPREE
jgi:nucleotide-binding universal stress UspA family protein